MELPPAEPFASSPTFDGITITQKVNTVFVQNLTHFRYNEQQLYDTVQELSQMIQSALLFHIEAFVSNLEILTDILYG